MKMSREDKRQEHFEHHHLGRGLHLGRWDHPHRRGILRTWVFIILRQEPRNGAELMNQIELVSQGNWRPSPGSIYPLLDQLCKEESISKREDGKYEITEKGKKELKWPYEMYSKQPRSADGAIEEMNSYISYLEDLKRMDPSKIAPSIDKLKNVRDRLTTIIGPT
jgi:DNA-binding PadR family transcriptional regulator